MAGIKLVTLRELRSKRRETQADVARNANVAASWISQLERLSPEQLLAPSVLEVLKNLGYRVHLLIEPVDDNKGERFILTAPEEASKETPSSANMSREDFVMNNMDALKERFKNARRGDRGDRWMQADFCKKLGINITAEVQRNRELRVQLYSQSRDGRRALSLLYDAIKTEDREPWMRLETSPGHDPEPGTLRSVGIRWWPKGSDYSVEKTRRTKAIDWWIRMAKRHGAKAQISIDSNS